MRFKIAVKSDYLPNLKHPADTYTVSESRKDSMMNKQFNTGKTN